MQVQSSCFAHKTDCFLTLLLSSSSSSVLKFPNIPARRGWKLRISRREDSYFSLLSVVYFSFPCPIWLLNVYWKAYVAIFRSADEKREKKEYSTRIEVGFNGRSIRAELFRRREKSRGNRGFFSDLGVTPIKRLTPPPPPPPPAKK